MKPLAWWVITSVCIAAGVTGYDFGMKMVMDNFAGGGRVPLLDTLIIALVFVAKGFVALLITGILRGFGGGGFGVRLPSPGE